MRVERHIDTFSVAVVIIVAVGQVTLVVTHSPAWPVIAVLGLIRFTFLVEHNHVHRSIFRAAAVNRAFDTLLFLSGGIPADYYRLQHVQNHHRFNNAEGDWTSPFRFEGCRYPDRPCSKLKYVLTFAPTVYYRTTAAILEPRNRAMLRRTLVSALVVGGVLAALGAIDLVAVLIFFGIPWLAPSVVAPLANWRHHEGCDYTTVASSANNDLRLSGRWLGLNIGYHREHHHRPAAHWSDLPAIRIPS